MDEETSVAETGRTYALMRLAAGVSLRAVAAALGVAPETLRHWEIGRAPLPADRAAAWSQAIAHVLAARERELARAGFTRRDLARGRALVARLAGVA